MIVPPQRLMLLAIALAGAAVLGLALAAEQFGGLVPCALCLVERVPWRLMIYAALFGLVMPLRWTGWMLALVVVLALGGAAVGAVHVGVEQHWWPSPLPECVAPHFSGTSIADRLASMPEKPSMSCEDASYPVSFLPVTMAELNLLASLALAVGVTIFLARTRRSTP